MARFLILAPLLLALGACDRGADERPVVVDAVEQGARGDVERVLLRSALAQGLVRFDAAGQVEPGLAERWNMVDDGRSYIFRLGDATWSDGRPVTAEQVVAALRRAVRVEAAHRLTPFLRSIDEIVAMTPQVIEVRLKRPNTELLTLLAQPELAVIRGPQGTGPLRRLQGRGIRLRAPVDPEAPPPIGADEVRLRGSRAALAVVRFAEKRSDLVLGGDFADWPLVAAANVRPADVRVDPARGLFGFAFVGRAGFLSTPFGRAAVGMVLQSANLPGRIDSGWGAADTVLPERLDLAGRSGVAAVAQPDRGAALGDGAGAGRRIWPAGTAACGAARRAGRHAAVGAGRGGADPDRDRGPARGDRRAGRPAAGRPRRTL
ncbi:ABC transporter substrate-binding protein [Sphingomonas hankookensis]|uniref:ABC transporter substrate-binding protein n=1 Tax=Sphingomonas hankookensis TaxID=563996 RepID=UPI003D302A3B